MYKVIPNAVTLSCLLPCFVNFFYLCSGLE